MSAAEALPRFGLVWRLALTSVVVGSITALAGAAALQAAAQSALRTQIEDLNLGEAQRLENAVDDRVTGALGTLELLARNQKVIALDPVESQIELRVFRSTAAYDTISLFDRRGRPVAGSASRFLVKRGDIDPRPELVEALAGTGSSVRTVPGRPSHLELAVAVEDPPGSIIGALSVTVPIEDVRPRIEALRLGRTGVARLVDGEGRTLAHPQRERVLAAEPFPVRLILPAGRASGVAVLERNGRDVLFAAVATRSFDGAVVVEQALEDAVAPVQGRRRDLVLILLSVVGITVGASIAAGRWLLSPLRPLSQAVNRLGRGDRSARVEAVHRSDELGHLGGEFNRMAEALDRQLEQLTESNQRLAEAQQRFSAALEDAPIGIAIVGLDGRFQRVNQALCAMVGATEDALLRAHFSSIMAQEPLEDILPEGRRMLRGETRTVQTEQPFVHADGTDLWVLLNVTIVSGRKGAPLHFFCQLQDITARRRAEEELRRLDHAKSEFVANAAHELRTPLAAIGGLTDLLAYKRHLMTQEQIAECADALGRQGERARRLIVNMLDLARVETGKLVLRPASLNLASAVASALESAGTTAASEVAVAVGPALRVIADPEALDQVLVNLLTNAHRHGGTGVAVEASSDGESVVVTVVDRGRGVPEEMVPKLFEPFGRGPDAPPGEGSGLGLALCRRIVEAMGGTIWYERARPSGARFSFRLRAGR